MFSVFFFFFRLFGRAISRMFLPSACRKPERLLRVSGGNPDGVPRDRGRPLGVRPRPVERAGRDVPLPHVREPVRSRFRPRGLDRGDVSVRSERASGLHEDPLLRSDIALPGTHDSGEQEAGLCADTGIVGCR